MNYHLFIIDLSFLSTFIFYHIETSELQQHDHKMRSVITQHTHTHTHTQCARAHTYGQSTYLTETQRKQNTKQKSK